MGDLLMGFLRRTLGSNWPWQVNRDVTPLEGTNMSLFNSIIPAWWQANQQGQFDGTLLIAPNGMADRVWVANRCQHLNASQVAGMPLRFHGTGSEPAWVSSPDPNLFPNGVSDAIYAIVDQLYGWGYSLQYVTDFYSDGFPRQWTVIPSSACEPRFNKSGVREYKLGDSFLDPRRVIQIDRNPTTAAHGTSALRAYAQNVWSLLAAGNQSMSVSQGGLPQVWLEVEGRLQAGQAEELQEQYMSAVSRRNGAPPVFSKGVKPNALSINPKDLALLDTQEWNSRVTATAYGVPSVLLNMALTGGLTYQNPLALMQMWWFTELRQTAKRIDDAFSAQMLPRGSWVQLDASDITASESTPDSSEDDGQFSQVANATPAQQPRPLTAIGGGAG